MTETEGCYAGSKPPLLTDNQVKYLCQTLLNLHIVNVKELNSYDDRNFNVFTNNGEQFVLKITNSIESNEYELIEAQNEMMLFLHRKQFQVPYPMEIFNGNFIIRTHLPLEQNVTDETNRPVNNVDNSSVITNKIYAIRLLKFIPGTILYNVQLDRNLLIDCGQYLAKINLTLETFHNETIKRRNFQWYLGNVGNIIQYIQYIQTPSRRELVANCVKEFETMMANEKDSLKYGYLHGDFNEQNIIVRQCNSMDEHGTNSWEIFGLIDFGDICYGPRIYDIAILLAYIMLLNTEMDPIRLAPKFVLQGYNKLIPLSRKDIELILICAKARLSQSLTLGAYTWSYQPDNKYLLTTAEKGWPILEQLCNYNRQQLIEYWQ